MDHNFYGNYPKYDFILLYARALAMLTQQKVSIVSDDPIYDHLAGDFGDDVLINPTETGVREVVSDYRYFDHSESDETVLVVGMDKPSFQSLSTYMEKNLGKKLMVLILVGGISAQPMLRVHAGHHLMYFEDQARKFELLDRGVLATRRLSDDICNAVRGVLVHKGFKDGDVKKVLTSLRKEAKK